MPPLPTEAPRPLYEILPEVKQSTATASDIYSSSHSYAMPAQVNIQKTIDITKNVAAASTDTSKEDEKKKQEKKDKYKVKF